MTHPLKFVARKGDCIFTVRHGEQLLVGRKGDVDVQIDHIAVGKKQCRIDYSSDRCLIMDAGSPGGTYVNNRHILKPTALHPGDVINFGQLEFVVNRFR